VTEFDVHLAVAWWCDKMADTRDLLADIAPCFLYSSVNSNTEILCASLLFYHKLNLCVTSAQ